MTWQSTQKETSEIMQTQTNRALGKLKQKRTLKGVSDSHSFQRVEKKNLGAKSATGAVRNAKRGVMGARKRVKALCF